MVNDASDGPTRTARPTTPELMDSDTFDQAEMDRSLAFIRWVNRWLGGTSSLLGVLSAQQAHWPRDRAFRWLDLGTGAADIPLAVDAWARRRNLPVECVALDRHPMCLDVARRLVGPRPTITVTQGDALDLDHYDDGCFDLVHAGMFLHHLTDEQIVVVLKAMGRIARTVWVWNDLLRTRLSRLGIALLTVAAPASVRFDARLSVAKGFTPMEVRALARAAALDVTIRSRPLVGRFVAVGDGQI